MAGHAFDSRTQSLSAAGCCDEPKTVMSFSQAVAVHGARVYCSERLSLGTCCRLTGSMARSLKLCDPTRPSQQLSLLTQKRGLRLRGSLRPLRADTYYRQDGFPTGRELPKSAGFSGQQEQGRKFAVGHATKT